MKKNIAKLFSITAILFSFSAFAADDMTVVKTAVEPAKPIVGRVTNVLIADAPLPNDYVLGKKTAKIVVVEYASLSCPHCAHFSNVVMPDLIKNYVDTGKIRYVLRQFPHNEPAFKGAMLVNCVGEKDHEKYFTFSKVLFDAQNKWAFDGNFQAGLETIAGVGGVSKEEFKKCMDDTALETKLLKDKKQAIDELHIEGVPYFFIDGEVYSGDRTLEAVSKEIDSRLAKK
jgi:protein-disulfide isomerase